MSADRWLSYADAAATLKMTRESLRARARREHWPKKLNNTGAALVLVPVDAESIAERIAPRDREPSTPYSEPQPDPQSIRIAELEGRLIELRQERDRARQERDREREDRLAERGRADLERDRADRLARELTELSKRFAGSTDDARARQDALQGKVDQLHGELTAVRVKPWWRRLAG